MIPVISVDFMELNFQTLAPMIVALLGALVIICIDLANKHLDKSLYIMLTVVFLSIDLVLVYGFSGAVRGFFDIMLVDGISILAQLTLLILSIAFVLLAFGKQKLQEYRYPEYFALYLFAVAGFQFMVSSDSLIMIFVGLETASIAIYTMVAMHNRMKTIEAAIKYFTMGALATAFFTFGAMIFYAVTGTVELGKVSEILVTSDFNNYALILMGITFMLGALGFKLSLVPFHSWVPDVYEGSTAAFAGFLAVVPKIAAFVVVLRIFEIFVSAEDTYVQTALYIIAVVTMTMGNLMALSQTDIKRMLAFSSISHAGFVLCAILIGTTQATTGIFLYWILFAIANLGAFGILWINRNKNASVNGQSPNSIHAYAGLVKKSPLLAAIMAMFMLSLAGVPPFSVFWGKLYLIGAAVNADHLSFNMYLALIMALNSAIAVYYYVKPVVFMFFKEGTEVKDEVILSNSTTMLQTLLGVFAILSIASIFLVEPLIEFISYYVQISGY